MTTSATGPAPLATVTRRDLTTGTEVPESHHLGHVVVVGPDARLAASLGDPTRVTFVRSTAKPFQAAACLELLAATDPPPTALPGPAEIAVGWASHRAEPHHLATVERLLARSGTAPDALTCPPALGEHDPGAGPARVHSDCSGKHALFALTAARMGLDRDAILAPDGPLQRVVLRVVADALGPAKATGTDGCGAPAVAVELAGLARGFAALAGDDRWARVRRAGLEHPAAVGGHGRLETALLEAGTVAKSGAEGVFAAGWVDAEGGAWGLAVKAEDGAKRAATVTAARVLRALGRLPADAWEPAAVLGGGVPAGTTVTTAEVAALADGLAD